MTTKAYNVLLAATSAAPGSSAGALGAVSAVANLSVLNNAKATVTASLQNSGSAPGVPASVVVQTSGDNQTWRNFAIVAGDSIAGSSYSWTFPLPRGTMFARGVCYGNTNNAVTVSFEIQIESD